MRRAARAARGGALPRVRPTVETNKVQRPHINRALQQFIGARQAHVAPGLSEGLQPVVIVGDIREDPRTAFPESFAAFYEVVPDGVNVKRAIFVNPLTSERIAVLKKLHVYGAEDWQAGPSIATKFVYDLVPPTGFVLTIGKFGQRLVTGYQPSVLGGPNPLGQSTGSDIQFPPRPSAMGWKNVAIDGIAGAYYWQGTIGGAEQEILEIFDPRLIVYPGGTAEFYAVDNNFHAYLNLWWDEYPLT